MTLFMNDPVGIKVSVKQPFVGAMGGKESKFWSFVNI